MSVIADPGGANKQHHRVRDDGDGLRLRQVADVASHHGEIGLAGRKRIRRLSALGVSTILSRTGALVAASRLASADTIRLASPSSDPTAMVSVVGREYQR